MTVICSRWSVVWLLLAVSGAAGALRYEPVEAPFHYGHVHRVAVAPDAGLIASIGIDDTLRLWRVRDGSLEWTVPAPRRVSALLVRDDGSVVVGTEQGDLAWFDRPNGRVVDRIRGHAGEVTVLREVSEDHVASGSVDQTARVWELESRFSPGRSLAHSAPVRDLAVDSRGGRMVAATGASGGSTSAVVDWDLTTGRQVRVLSLLGTEASCTFAAVAIRADGSEISATCGLSLYRWDGVSGARLGRHGMVDASERANVDPRIAPLTYSQDGTHLVGWYAGRLLEHDARTGAPFRRTTVADGFRAAFSTETDQVAVGLSTGGVQRVEPGERPNLTLSPGPPVDTVVFRPRTIEMVTAGGDLLVAWKGGALRPIQRVSVPGRGPHRLAFTATGGRLAHSRGFQLMMRDGFDIDESEAVLTHSSRILALGWSAGGRLALSSEDGQVVVLPDAGNGAVRFQAHEQAVYDLAWHPDGERLYSASEDGRLAVLSVKTGKVLRRVQPPGAAVAIPGLSVSPDGQWIASTQAFLSMHDAVQLWSADGAHVSTISTPELSPHDVVFGPRGQLLVTANVSASVDVRRASDGSLLQRLPADGGYAMQVAMSDDRRYIAAALAGNIQSVRLWRRVR